LTPSLRRVAGRPGEQLQQRRIYAGRAPVTRRSGKRDLVVAHRLACNRYLADAVHKWAFASLRRSAWAREFYDAQRARGKNHHAALRALGNRWLEVLWHCLTNEVPYNEAVHLANRNRALTAITSPAAWPLPAARSRHFEADGARGLTEDVSSLTPDRATAQTSSGEESHNTRHHPIPGSQRPRSPGQISTALNSRGPHGC
jgi:hypothetical protein